MKGYASICPYVVWIYSLDNKSREVFYPNWMTLNADVRLFTDEIVIPINQVIEIAFNLVVVGTQQQLDLSRLAQLVNSERISRANNGRNNFLIDRWKLSWLWRFDIQMAFFLRLVADLFSCLLDARSMKMLMLMMIMTFICCCWKQPLDWNKALDYYADFIINKC